MVLSVCRRILRDSHEIEDAFQAAFHTLVRKGASIRRPEVLAGWLYRVAYRIAVRLRSETTERMRREQPDVEARTSSSREERAAYDLRAVLDEEIDALPERYRQAIVLCFLQGKTHAEAGRLLGRPTGTISCWLKRGRELLRNRLAQRSIASTAAFAVLGESEVRATPPAALVQSTCRAASAFVAGGEGAAVISARVVMLAEGAMKGMAATKLQWTLVLGLRLSMAATGAGMWVYQPSPTHEPPAERKAETDASKPSPQQDKQAAGTDCFGDPLPEGAVGRLGTVRQRAVDAETAISPDGKTIVALSNANIFTLKNEITRLIQFFDAETGRLRERRVRPGVAWSRSVSLNESWLSADARLLAVHETNDSPLDLWDVFTGKRLHRLHREQRKEIYSAVFSPDNKRPAVAERDEKGEKTALLLWDIASDRRRELTEYEGSPRRYEDSPKLFVFSADGKLLASETGDHIICWQVAKGEELWRVAGQGCDALAFTLDGRTLIAAPASYFHDSPDGQQKPEKGEWEHETWRAVRDLCKWRAWDAATGKAIVGLKLPEEDAAYRAEFAIAPDNRTLIFVPISERRKDGSVSLWDLRTSKLLHKLAIVGKTGGDPKDIRIGPFFPDGKSFLTNNGMLQRWELATGRPLLPETEKLGHWSEVCCSAYSPDGRRLASAAHDGTIRLWDVATAKPLHVLRLPKEETSDLAFTPDGKHLISGLYFDEIVHVWDTETGKEVRHLKLAENAEMISPFRKMRLSPDGRTLLVAGYGPSLPSSKGYNGIISRWDLATGKRKSRAECKEVRECDALSPDGTLLTVDGELLDTATGKRRAKLEGEKGECLYYAFSSDGRLVAGIVTTRELDLDKIDWDAICGEIRVWETKTGRALHRIPIPFSGSGRLAFSPDGCYLAHSGMKDFQIWDLSTGKVALKYKRHEPRVSGYTNSFISCLTFAPDGRTLATGHPDSTVLIWNAALSKPARRSD